MTRTTNNNSTPPTSSRRWCFTLNNYTEEEEITLQELGCTHIVHGKETGKNGTPHLQGFATFNTMRRLSAMKKINDRAHWEVASSISRINHEHCVKGSQPKEEWDDLNTSGRNCGVDADVFEKGKCPSQGQRTELECACDSLNSGASMKTIAKEFRSTFAHNYKGLQAHQLITLDGHYSDTTRGVRIWGPSGVGKSSKVWKDYGDSLFDKPQNKWFDGYAGEETILIDDFDKKGACLSHYLKRWADHYPCTGETKGGTVHLRHHHLIITSQCSIEKLFGKPNDDGEVDEELIDALTHRFQVVHMDNVASLGKKCPRNHSQYS